MSNSIQVTLVVWSCAGILILSRRSQSKSRRKNDQGTVKWLVERRKSIPIMGEVHE